MIPCVGIVAALLDAGASVALAENRGLTARDLAELESHDEIAQLLADAEVARLIQVIDICTAKAFPPDIVTLVAKITTGRVA